MSGLIVACARLGVELPFSADDLRRCAARVSPDNITPRAPLLFADPGLLVAVVNPMPDLPQRAGRGLSRRAGRHRGWLGRPRVAATGRLVRRLPLGRRAAGAGDRQSRLQGALVRARRRPLPRLDVATGAGLPARRPAPQRRRRLLAGLERQPRPRQRLGHAASASAGGDRALPRPPSLDPALARGADRPRPRAAAGRGPSAALARRHPRDVRGARRLPRHLAAAALRRPRQPHAARRPDRGRQAAALRHLGPAPLARRSRQRQRRRPPPGRALRGRSHLPRHRRRRGAGARAHRPLPRRGRRTHGPDRRLSRWSRHLEDAVPGGRGRGHPRRRARVGIRHLSFGHPSAPLCNTSSR